MLIFSLEFFTSGLGFPQHPRGPLSQRPTKRVGIRAWHVFVEARAWTWGATTHTDISLRDTPQPGVPCVRSIACVGFACAYFNYGSIWLPIMWVITRPPIKQDLG